MKYYNSSHLMVFPSFFEGSPRVVKEALASNCLVLCSDISGTRMIDPKGEVLVFFNPGDAETLAKKIIDIIHNYDHYSSRKLKSNQLINKFSPKRIAKERAAFYMKL